MLIVNNEIIRTSLIPNNNEKAEGSAVIEEERHLSHSPLLGRISKISDEAARVDCVAVPHLGTHPSLRRDVCLLGSTTPHLFMAPSSPHHHPLFFFFKGNHKVFNFSITSILGHAQFL